MTSRENNLIWIDLEMTGLNVNQDHILEIATIITDSSPEHSGRRTRAGSSPD